jgi:hypothetical protein
MQRARSGLTRTDARGTARRAMSTAVRRALRSVTVVMLGVGACSTLSAPACGGGDTCGGTISSSCADLDVASCAKAQGCHTVPGTCTSLCETPGVNCATSGCQLVGGACKPHCEGVTDEATCLSFTASVGIGSPEVHECEWGADGCKSPCGTFTTHDACQAERVAGCLWTECAGAPKGPCSSYSGSDCPTFLGCDRTSHPSYSAQ